MVVSPKLRIKPVLRFGDVLLPLEPPLLLPPELFLPVPWPPDPFMFEAIFCVV